MVLDIILAQVLGVVLNVLPESIHLEMAYLFVLLVLTVSIRQVDIVHVTLPLKVDMFLALKNGLHYQC